MLLVCFYILQRPVCGLPLFAVESFLIWSLQKARKTLGPQSTQSLVKIELDFTSLGGTLAQRSAECNKTEDKQSQQIYFHCRPIITILSGWERVRRGECSKLQLTSTRKQLEQAFTALHTRQHDATNFSDSSFIFSPCACVL